MLQSPSSKKARTHMGNIYVAQQTLPACTEKLRVPLSFTRHVLMCRVKKRLFTANVLWYWSSRRSSFIRTFLIFLRNNLVVNKYITNMRNFQITNHKELSNRTPSHPHSISILTFDIPFPCDLYHFYGTVCVLFTGICARQPLHPFLPRLAWD